MFCSSCGVAVTQGLSYCNYCGARLSSAKSDSATTSREVKPELLVSAMVGLFILGLAAIGFLMGIMKSVLNLGVGQILFFLLLCFLMMFTLEGVILRLLLRRRSTGEGAGEIRSSNRQTTNELDAAQARALPEPVSSVTEHTTRAFDPIHRVRIPK